jgi:hypothetical protein
MWLPKEERDLLAYYYKKIKKPNEWYTFDPWQNPFELIDAIGYFRLVRRIGRKVKYWFRIKILNSLKADNEPRSDKEWAVNERLQERGLIELGRREIDKIPVKLSLQGWDLGRKYHCLLVRSGLWFKEYKDHWVWLIVAFIGGIFGALIINTLSK